MTVLLQQRLPPSHFTGDPKTLSSGSPFRAPARRSAETQHVPIRQLRFLLYSVYFLPLDRPRTTENGRFAYFSTVVPFRKLRNKGKIGSP